MTDGCKTHWQPSASIETLRLRANTFSAIRTFFKQRGVMEVDTPLIARASVTDPHIESITLKASPLGSGNESWYLQTSPEFAMKRLLAAGSGDIYQIAHVFRRGEVGRLHNPEFTMLEWYRLERNHQQLMDEVTELLFYLGISTETERLSYGDVFKRYTGLDPHQCTDAMLVQCACDLGVGQDLVNNLSERDQWLDLLMSQVVGPKLGIDCPLFIYDFPPSQAALARIGVNGLAERFELFICGIEIANGYHELTDAQELLQRFDHDNKIRRQLNFDEVVIDRRLLAAMHSGLPACAGVAIGIDRLIMFKAQTASIAAVMAFDAKCM